MVEYRTFTLDNGLRVAHSCDPSTAMVAVNVLYDTGSRDESRDLTGIAHLFEHLMFGGSANVNDFSGEVERAGGTDNAWTSTDFTNFYEVLPAQNLETAFWLESDRMLSPAIDSRTLDVQRQVVIEEFKQQCLNRPYGDIAHHLRRLLYAPAHAYSWPVIGLTPDHIARVTVAQARDWFDRHYGPDNAVVTVCGNVSFDEVERLAHKWFDSVPRRSIGNRVRPAPQFAGGAIVEHVTADVPQTALIIAFPMDPYGTPDYFTADTITDLLASGRSSRFYQRLLLGGSGLFSEVDASIAGTEQSGYLMLNARLNDNSEQAVDRARDMMLAEARLLAGPGEVDDHELTRCMNRFEANFNFSNMAYQTMAANLAMAVMHGEDINMTVARQQRTSADDIRRVAAKIFNSPSSVTLVYGPQ